MHPSLFWYRKARHYDPCRGRLAYAVCGPAESFASPWQQETEARFAVAFSEFHDALFAASGLGVRRPLRFLAMRLELDRDQVAEVAKVIERVKIERAQATVDLRRAASDIADALEEEDFDRERAQRVRDQRLEASQRVHDALASAIADLHGLLDAGQRRRLATLIRSGSLKL